MGIPSNVGLVQVASLPLFLSLREWYALLLRHVSYEFLNVKRWVEEMRNEGVCSHIPDLWLGQWNSLAKELQETLVSHRVSDSWNWVAPCLTPLVHQLDATQTKLVYQLCPILHLVKILVNLLLWGLLHTSFIDKLLTIKVWELNVWTS